MNQYKYDLEILIPVSLTGVYSARLNYFLKSGLRNVKDHKVLLNLLIGTESLPELAHNFPENVEVRKIKSDLCHPATKIYDFYSNYNFDQSKWIMRIDDDSITDIDRIMNFLSDLDCEKHYYFVGHQCFSNGQIDIPLNILERYGKLEKLKNQVSHEVEVAIYSNGTFKKVIEENRKEILSRSKIEGSLAHIHKICHDRNPELITILDKILQQEPTEFSGFSFAYLSQLNKQTAPQETKIILLNNNGTIVCKHRIEEQYWTYYENNLSFYDNSGKTMFEFTNFNLDKKNESSSSFGKSYLQMIGF